MFITQNCRPVALSFNRTTGRFNTRAMNWVRIVIFLVASYLRVSQTSGDSTARSPAPGPG